MPEYLAPAVYVEEVDTGSKPIEGVSTSTAGMLGVAERGPVNVPILITSAGEYRRWFGDLLELNEFSNANGQDPHCFLPYAIEGFFTNGGKRVYVTRIESRDARRSLFRLADRGGPASVNTALLRSAAPGTGTLVNGPTIAITEPGALANGDMIRIGDGSAAEYRTITGALQASRQIPLRYPLSFLHPAAAPITNFTRVVQPNPGAAALTVVTAVAPGAITLTLQGAAAVDATNLAVGQLLEIGGITGEHRFITALGPVGGAGNDTRTVTFDVPLVNAYAAAANVVRLQFPPLVADILGTTTLLTQTLPGDAIAFGDVLGANFVVPNSLVRVGGPTTEVRSIGALRRLTLGQGAYRQYPSGTRVDRMTATPQVFLTTAAVAGGATSIPLNSVAGLAAGQTIVIDPGVTDVVRVIQSVNALNVTLTAPLAAPFGAPGVAAQLRRRLSAAAVVGSVTLALDNRVGVAVGDVFLVGPAGAQEYVAVTGLLPPVGAAPNAGTVVLAAPTQVPHAIGEDIRLQAMAPTGGLASQPAYLALRQNEGVAMAFVTNDPGFAVGDVLQFQLPGRAFYHTLAAMSNPAPREAVLDAPLDRTHDAGSIVVQRTAMIEVTALDTGHWGDRLRLSIEDDDQGLVTGAFATSVFGGNQLVVSSLNGIEPGTILEMFDVAGTRIGPLMKITAIDRNNGRATVDGGLDPAHIAAIGMQPRLRSLEFSLTVRLMRRPDALVPARDEMVVGLEEYHGLSMDPRHSRYFRSVIGDVNGVLRISDRRPDGASWFIRTRDLGSPAAQLTIRLGPETLRDILPSGDDRPARHAMAGGRDGIAMLTDADYIGVDADDPDLRTGLFALRNIEEISIVAVPGRTTTDIQNALIAHCELMRYRFAVLDGPQPERDLIADVRAQRQQYDTRYAALYHPWLLIRQPFPAPNTPPMFSIPPSGQVVGVYARTDIERGVHKAPANEVVRGINGVHRILSKSEQDILNPYPVNINVIRDFRRTNRGIRVWGGRVITSDSDWKYVNVRRLVIFIEASVERGLQWVVFEPNAEPLWARVRRSISNFLRVIWRNGALEGTKPEEAFFVRCDRTTMTQAEIDNGQLIVLVGVAPVKPAEFVIVRIGLWTAHSED